MFFGEIYVDYIIIDTILSVTEANSCINSPCLNGGLCMAKGHSYECFCKSHPEGSIAYTGKRCELQVNLDMITSIYIFLSFKLKKKMLNSDGQHQQN